MHVISSWTEWVLVLGYHIWLHRFFFLLNLFVVQVQITKFYFLFSRGLGKQGYQCQGKIWSSNVLVNFLGESKVKFEMLLVIFSVYSCGAQAVSWLDCHTVSGHEGCYSKWGKSCQLSCRVRGDVTLNPVCVSADAWAAIQCQCTPSLPHTQL